MDWLSTDDPPAEHLEARIRSDTKREWQDLNRRLLKDQISESEWHYNHYLLSPFVLFASRSARGIRGMRQPEAIAFDALKRILER